RAVEESRPLSSTKPEQSSFGVDLSSLQLPSLRVDGAWPGTHCARTVLLKSRFNGDARSTNPGSEVQGADTRRDGAADAHFDIRGAEFVQRYLAEFLARNLRQSEPEAPRAIKLVNNQPEFGRGILDGGDDDRRRDSATAPDARAVVLARRRSLA